MDRFQETLEKILNVEEPWKINKIDVHHPTKSVNVYIDYDRGTKFPCSECGEKCKIHDSSYRVWRHLDLCDYRCYLNIKIPRVNCLEHGVKVISKHPFGRQNSHYSFKFDKQIMNKVREMSVSAISAELGEPDNNLWRVIHNYIDKAIEQIDCSRTTRIGVDEKSCKKGHNYVTIFTDLETGNVIYVVEGRDEATFAQFYERLFALMGDPNYITMVSMDMSKSFISGHQLYFSHAELYFDRFHIKKALNKAVDEVRKQEVTTNCILKNTKYIFLKNETNLTEKQAATLSGFLKNSTLDTVKAYEAKLQFDLLWSIPNRAKGPMLEKWIEQALILALKPIDKFIKMINNHKIGVINSMKSFVTNAVAEGLNSVFQLAKSRARGFRNITNFMNLIYYLGNDFTFNFH
jgi:transposase